MIKLYPSLIATNQLNLAATIKALEPYCDGFHLDVMDFYFVHNQTLSFDIINQIASFTKKQLWVHLMVQEPIKWLPRLKLRSHDLVSFHVESTVHAEDMINALHAQQLLASVAINPDTPIDHIRQYLPLIDQLLIMSVNPGFSGQKFIELSLEKITQAHTYKQQHNARFAIGIDGGINEYYFKQAIRHGAQDIVLGSYLFNQKDQIALLKQLRSTDRSSFL